MKEEIDELGEYTKVGIGWDRNEELFVHLHKHDVTTMENLLSTYIGEREKVEDWKDFIFFQVVADKTMNRLSKISLKFPLKNTEIHVRLYGPREDQFIILERTLRTMSELGFDTILGRLFVNRGYNRHIYEKLKERKENDNGRLPLDGFCVLTSDARKRYRSSLHPRCYGRNVLFSTLLRLNGTTAEGCLMDIRRMLAYEHITISTETIRIHPSLLAILGENLSVVVVLTKAIEYSPGQYCFSQYELRHNFVLLLSLPGGQRIFSEYSGNSALRWCRSQLKLNGDMIPFYSRVMDEHVLMHIRGSLQDGVWTCIPKHPTISPSRRYYRPEPKRQKHFSGNSVRSPQYLNRNERTNRE